MIGLLKKDQTLLWNAYGKNFLVVLLIYTAMMLASDSLVFVMYALVFLGGMYAVSTLTLDEYSRWDTYARTLPVTPQQIVGSKYLLALGWSAFCFVLGTVLCALGGAVRGDLAATWPQTLAGSITALAVVLGYNAVALPLSYQFGAAKARSATMVALCILIAAVVLAGGLLANGLPSADSADAPGAAGLLLLVGVLTAAALAAYLVSFFISTGIYRRKAA